MEREDFFKRFSRYLKEEPVFAGEHYRVEIRNDYGVSQRLYSGGEYIAFVQSIEKEEDWAYVPSTFVSFDFFFLLGYPSDIIDLITSLKNATPQEIDELAVEIKRQMEYALEGGYFSA